MISLLLPTCKRPHLLNPMLNSLQQTAGLMYELEVIAVVDNDIISANIAMEHHCLVEHSPLKRGALYCWNRALQLATKTGGNDLIIPCGDDQLFHSGWLGYALESHKERLDGYGVIGMNDLAYDGNTQVATMFMFDRLFLEKEMGGIFAPPMYKYYCIDLEWNEKAKMLGRFFWDSRSIVEHVHSAHGKRPLDDLDREKMDAGWMEEDNKTFQARKEAGFPIEWSPIV